MRQIILDIETTGLNPELGDRIIEIGCIELINRKITNNNLHLYINPERNSSHQAFLIHKIDNNFLKKKPKFSQIVNNFCNYIKNSEVIIHNSKFDISFLNKEFKLLNLNSFTYYILKIIDSLKIAKKKFPGQKNSLNALCNRYKILNFNRNIHGALLDAKLLTSVYLAMTSKQKNFYKKWEIKKNKFKKNINLNTNILLKNKNVIYANKKELLKHKNILNIIEKKNKKKCIWNKIKI
ncbi:DNA polymerase III subunit epsilon [Candidatus Zinderia endosymbiont of Aphrophora alni]|uniref:DNA polymerase III subunit epsilon n=1 Tax=Candidatus Zinderia endosymbiont of Aphrophora alni TaxID=3077951 RepID=UPI0030D1D50E